MNECKQLTYQQRCQIEVFKRSGFSLASIGKMLSRGILTTFLLMFAGQALAQQLGDCNTGTYTMNDGSLLDISKTPTNIWRWRTLDGLFGLVNPSDANPTHPGAINLTIQAQTCDLISVGQQRGSRVAFEQIETDFASGNTQLRGRLVLPLAATEVPIVVVVHGSESSSAVQFNAWQRQLPALGVGVFVFDKRGTGESSGKYTQDFDLLADDAAAAVLEARRLAGNRLETLTIFGTSQGGWVAPLTATQTPVDQVIVGYGLAISPNDEDREQVLLEMKALGYSGADLTEADEVTRVTGLLMASGFREGFEAYAQVRKAYGSRPWFSKITGEYTGEILRYPALVLHLFAPIARRVENQGTPWGYDPMPTLNSLRMPQLWVIAGADIEAPPETTLNRLTSLKRDGRPLTILEFPNTDHGIVEFIETSGDRTATRVAEGYLRAVADFAKYGKLSESAYGNAIRVD